MRVIKNSKGEEAGLRLNIGIDASSLSRKSANSDIAWTSGWNKKLSEVKESKGKEEATEVNI